jgi:UDP-glucose 4-epimerase
VTSPILITGANGRIGRRLQRIAREQATVVPYAGPHAVGDQKALDLADELAVRAVLRAVRPRAVIHLASVVGAACEADPSRAELINVEATVALASAAREVGVERFVLASTAAIYGDARRRAMAESDSPQALGVYATTKLHAEEALVAFAGDMAVDCLRIFNVYGPGMDDSLIARLERARPESPAQLNGLDDFVRDYVHVDDVARALFAASQAGGAAGYRILNVGSGVPRSNRALRDALPVDARRCVIIGPEVESYSCADISLIRRELSWSPAVPWSISGG